MKPTKWKMAVLIWSAMFPFSTLLTYGLSLLPFTAQWPLIARTFCLTCLLVPYMVFLALPFLAQRFQKWLQPDPHQPQSQLVQSAQLASDRTVIIKPEPSQVSPNQYALS